MSVVCLGILATQFDTWGQIRRREMQRRSRVLKLRPWQCRYVQTAVSVALMENVTTPSILRLFSNSEWCQICSHFTSKSLCTMCWSPLAKGFHLAELTWESDLAGQEKECTQHRCPTGHLCMVKAPGRGSLIQFYTFPRFWQICSFQWPNANWQGPSDWGGVSGPQCNKGEREQAIEK